MTEDSTIFDENCDDTEATASERIFDAYVHGQMCNVAKYGLWWTLLSPLLLSLFNGNFVSIGLSRFCLNVAIIFTTPTASVLLNKVTAKKMLLMSTIGRALIYVVFIPLSWILFQSKIKTFQGLDSNIFFAIAFFILICVDGIFLSFGNVIDIDNGGADIVMTEYDISMESIRKRRYNFIQVMCSDGAMLSLCPITGLLGVLYLEIWNRWILFNYDPQALILLLLMVTVFLFSSLYSLCSYTRMPTIRQRKRMLRNTLESNIALGFDEIFSNSRLFWRVLLLSIESAIEDIVMGILLLVCSLHFTRDGEYVISNMWLQLLISFSKLGAILAVLYVSRFEFYKGIFLLT